MTYATWKDIKDRSKTEEEKEKERQEQERKEKINQQQSKTNNVPPGNTPSAVPANPVIEIQSIDHKIKLIANTHLCIVDVWAEWCGPCKKAAPEFKKLAAEIIAAYPQLRIAFAKEEVKEVKEGYNITEESARRKLCRKVNGVPTFQIYVNGKFHDDEVGAGVQTGLKPKILKAFEKINEEFTLVMNKNK